MLNKTTQPDLFHTWQTRLPYKRGFRLVVVLLGCATMVAIAPVPLSGQDAVRMGPKVSLNNGLPPEADGITVEQRLGTQIPLNLPITDSRGRLINTGYLFNGQAPTIVTLNYSDCPMLCSVQLNALVRSLNELDLKVGKDFRILTLSIDPNESTEKAAETKAKYLEALSNQPGASEGWTFATAKQPIITQIADTLGFKYRFDPAIKQYNHAAMLAFVSPSGVITRYSLSIDYPADQLKLSLIEAGEGTVGTAVDQFIMWCYSYDPDSSSYTPAAWRIMRVCGFGFMCLMLVVLVPYWIGRKGSGSTTARADSQGSLSLESGLPEVPK